MKNFLLLLLTLITLTATGQDTTLTEKKVDPILSKLTIFHNKISTMNLDISTLNLDIDGNGWTSYDLDHEHKVVFNEVQVACTSDIKCHSQYCY